jgi:hypothetical protein
MNGPRFPNTMSAGKLATLVLSACFLMSSVLLAQPLKQTTRVGNAYYFLDGPTVRKMEQNKLSVFESRGLVQEPSQLLRPRGWEDSFLLLGAGSVAILDKNSSKVIATSEKAQLEVLSWGELAVIYQPGSESILVVASDGEVETVELPGLSSPPQTLGPATLIALAEEGRYYLLDRERLQSPKQYDHPFPSEQLRVTVSAGRALLWSPDSRKYLVAGQEQLRPLSAPPVTGVKALGEGGFLLALATEIVYLNANDLHRILKAPSILSPSNFHRSYFFEHGNSLQFLLFDKSSGLAALTLKYDGTLSGGILGQEEIVSLLSPPSTLDGRAFLLTETSLEEPKIHHSGQPVIDPQTGKPVTHEVKGHALYQLSKDGQWRVLSHDHRARLNGPTQILSGHLVYSTQTEPAHQVGSSRKIDWRYPYPKVVIHARQSDTGAPSWSLELNRGDSPSAARLPEKAWPVLEDDGLLLFTTEDGRLSALDMTNGKIRWTSKPLPLDDSRPSLYSWNDKIALLATNKTTRRLLLLAKSNGELLTSIAVNEFFNSQRTLNLIGVVVLCLALIAYIYLARKKNLFIRRIAGLEALDEAVGRATEMGKPVLYVTGLADVDDIQTWPRSPFSATWPRRPQNTTPQSWPQLPEP